MGLMATYDDFRRFLREQGCESNFLRAFYAYNDYTAFDEMLWEAFEDKRLIFASAFCWNSTAEGGEFWREVDRRWWQRTQHLDGGVRMGIRHQS